MTAEANRPPVFDPPVRSLLGPGPSEVSPRVLAALSRPPIGHLDPAFLALMEETQGLLRTVYRTKNPLTLPVSGTGMAGMECVLVNLIEPGDRVLIGVKGFFGGRMVEVAKRAGAEVRVIERPWGEVFDPSEVEVAVKEFGPKVIGLVHAETSTGAWQPVEEIAKIAQAAGSLLTLDCVTSLGGIPLEIDAWGIDAAYSGSQKCIGAPPGLSPVTFGPRAEEAMARRKTPVQSWYLDVSQVRRYWGSDRFYHHTAPINMNFAFREALATVVEEGLEARFERHRRNHQALMDGLNAMGLSIATAEGNRLPQLTCVRIPDGVDDLAIRKRLLTEWNLEIGGGLGDFKGKVWRIGLMGHSSRMANVTLVLSALATCLRDAGVPIK